MIAKIGGFLERFTKGESGRIEEFGWQAGALVAVVTVIVIAIGLLKNYEPQLWSLVTNWLQGQLGL